jgi:hypothetical protein
VNDWYFYASFLCVVAYYAIAAALMLFAPVLPLILIVAFIARKPRDD